MKLPYSNIETQIKFDIKLLEEKINSTIANYELWVEQEKLAQADKVSAPKEDRDNYLSFFKKKRESAQADILYYQEKLEQLKSKLIYL